jgi:hypothetical protein
MLASFLLLFQVTLKLIKIIYQQPSYHSTYNNMTTLQPTTASCRTHDNTIKTSVICQRGTNTVCHLVTPSSPCVIPIWLTCKESNDRVYHYVLNDLTERRVQCRQQEQPCAVLLDTYKKGGVTIVTSFAGPMQR